MNVTNRQLAERSQTSTDTTVAANRWRPHPLQCFVGDNYCYFNAVVCLLLQMRDPMTHLATSLFAKVAAERQREHAIALDEDDASTVTNAKQDAVIDIDNDEEMHAIPAGTLLWQWVAIMKRYYRNPIDLQSPIRTLGGAGCSQICPPVPMAAFRKSITVLSDDKYKRGQMSDAPEFMEFFLASLMDDVGAVFNGEAEDTAVPVKRERGGKAGKRSRNEEANHPRTSSPADAISRNMFYTIEEQWTCPRDACADSSVPKRHVRRDALLRARVFNIKQMAVDPFQYTSFSGYIGGVTGGAELQESRACPSCGEPVTVVSRIVDLPRQYSTLQLSWHRIPDDATLKYLLIDVIEEVIDAREAFSAASGDAASDFDVERKLMKENNMLPPLPKRERRKESSRSSAKMKTLSSCSFFRQHAKGTLTAIVCFQAKHYVCIVRSLSGEWYVCEDHRQPLLLGTRWIDVVAWMLSRKMAPLLLTYAMKVCRDVDELSEEEDVQPQERESCDEDAQGVHLPRPPPRLNRADLEKARESRSRSSHVQSTGNAQPSSPAYVNRLRPPSPASQTDNKQSLVAAVAATATSLVSACKSLCTPRGVLGEPGNSNVGKTLSTSSPPTAEEEEAVAALQAIFEYKSTMHFTAILNTLRRCGGDSSQCAEVLLVVKNHADLADINYPFPPPLKEAPSYRLSKARSEIQPRLFTPTRPATLFYEPSPCARVENAPSASSQIKSIFDNAFRRDTADPNAKLPSSLLRGGGGNVNTYAARKIGNADVPQTFLGRQFFISASGASKQRLADIIQAHGGTVLTKISQGIIPETLSVVMSVQTAETLLKKYVYGPAPASGGRPSTPTASFAERLSQKRLGDERIMNTALSDALKIVNARNVFVDASLEVFADRHAKDLTRLPSVLCLGLKAAIANNRAEAEDSLVCYRKIVNAAADNSNCETLVITNASVPPSQSMDAGKKEMKPRATHSTKISPRRSPIANRSNQTAVVDAIDSDDDVFVCQYSNTQPVDQSSPGVLRSAVNRVINAIAPNFLRHRESHEEE